MLYGIILAYLLVGAMVATLVVYFFRETIESTVRRLLPDDVADGWTRLTIAAVYVVGIAGAKGTTFEFRSANSRGFDAADAFVSNLFDALIASGEALVWFFAAFFVVAVVARLFSKTAGVTAGNAGEPAKTQAPAESVPEESFARIEENAPGEGAVSADADIPAEGPKRSIRKKSRTKADIAKEPAEA